MTKNECGNCTMCCKLLGIPEIEKPPSKWCPHCKVGEGCAIYETRPTSCQEFLCLWRLSPMGSREDLRPDKVKVVMTATNTGNSFYALVDPGTPDAWEKEPIYNLLCRMVDSGNRVIIGWGDTKRKLLLYKIGPATVGKRELLMSPPDKNGVQWFMDGGAPLADPN
jgi:hypothetical protein